MTRARVLIVDDSPANLKLARVVLEDAGLDLATASDAEEAQRRIIEFQPDLVLMDLQLPGMDGYTLTRSLKADPHTAHVSVVALTAYAMKGDRERALEAGCDGYITKPVDPLLLPKLVTAHLTKVRAEQASSLATTAPTVLVIDDNPAARKLLRIAFESEGFRVHEAEDARSALAWLERGRPQLIIQDLVLPDLDGVTLLQRIRQLDHARSLPVVCLSGFVDRMTAARTLDNGFAATLLKPVDPLALLELVRTQLCPGDACSLASAARAQEVLIVDSDALQLRLANYQLTGAGLRVRTADDPRQALASALAAPPVAIVCNVQMPGMNGFELCMSIRQSQALAHVAVILVASHSEASDGECRKLAKALGADAFTDAGHNWKNTLKLLREVLGRDQRGTLELSATLARDHILRCIQTQLDRQLHANATLVQRCLLQAAQLSVLAGVADSLARDETAVDSLSDVLAVSLDLAGIAKGALYLYGDGRLQPRDALGFSAAERAALSDCFGYVETVERLTTQGQVLRITRAAASDDRERAFMARAGLQSAIIAPVAWRDHYYGALLLGSDHPEVVGLERTAFARVLGSQVGQAIGLADAFARLHSSEERFRALVDSMDSVVVADRDRRITGTYGRDAPTGDPVTEDPNPTGAEHSWVGQPLEALWDEPRTESHRDAYTRALSGERVAYDWTRGVGIEARHFREALWPVRDAHGVVQSVMCVARETTAEKRLQAQVMVSDRMASVGMLAAGVAHEINNPLMAVLGNLQLALDGLDTLECLSTPQTSDMQQSLFDAFDAAKRVDAIVRDLRLFSRSDEESDSVDVRGVLESTLRMARAAIRNRARITRQYTDVPLVEASESRLGQVFLNLVINAAQALPEGDADTQEIRVSTTRQIDGRVRVEIADTGCGIPPEVARRLFTPFLTTKPVGVGTGLGLTICQRIVQALGGEISFESVVGKGTTFRVVLPPARRPRMLASARPAPKPALRRGRVLIIDDELLVGSLLAKSLGRDHETVHDTDARVALTRLRADPHFDVILCDLMMPKMGGVELYEALVRELPTLAARVIFLTGGAFTDATNEFLEHIPNLHLRKPINLADLRGTVNERVG